MINALYNLSNPSSMRVSISDFAEVIMGQSPPSETYNEIGIGLPFFQGKAEFGKLNPTVRKWCDSPNKTAITNDILISVRAPVGSVNIANTNCGIGRGLAAVRYNLCNMFLYYYFLFIEKRLDEMGTGTTFRAISADVLRQYKIELPPLAEQHRIVSKIEELFSDLDRGIETLKTAKEQLRVYRQAVLKYAFEGRLTNPDLQKGELPKGWLVKRLNEFGKVETGTTPPKSNPEYYIDGDIPFYKPTDLEANNNVHKAREHVTQLGLRKARFVPEGSTLVTCIGATIGKSGFLTKGGIFNQQINAITPKVSVLPKYLYYQTIAPNFQEQIKLNASATTLPILNKSKFTELVMNLCDIIEQNAIVLEIESRLSVCDKIEESIQQGLQQAEALRQSILKKAFEGKLVPQDPKDEPAHVLLERIKSERAAAQPVKKQKKAKA